jgi:hypothetical protein
VRAATTTWYRLLEIAIGEESALRNAGWKTQLCSWALLGVFCLLPAGCGSPKYPRTVSISGKVTWQGKPLTAGSVAFIPANAGGSQPSRSAGGEIGPDGVYRLSSFRSGDGVMPGQYRVTVESYISQPTHAESDKPYVWRIPRHYGKPAESGLTFIIPADASGHLVFDIDLKP